MCCVFMQRKHSNDEKCISWLKCRDRQTGEECTGVKRRSASEYVLQIWHATCNAIQLINKSRDYHVFTMWNVCLSYSALLSASPTIDSLTSLYCLSSLYSSLASLTSCCFHAEAA